MSNTTAQFVACIQNDDYPTSLEVRKIYQVLQDTQAETHHLLRVMDESGDDYLYPEDHFVALDLPYSIQEALNMAA